MWHDDGLGGLPVADLIVPAQRDTKSGGVVLSVAFPRPDIYCQTPYALLLSIPAVYSLALDTVDIDD